MTVDARHLQLGQGFQVGSGPTYPIELSASSTVPKTHSKASFSSFSTSSTSYVNITGAAITKVSEAAKNCVVASFPVDNGANDFSLQLTIDGSAQSQSEFADVVQVDNGMVHYFFLTDALTSASHTFQLQVKSVTGGSITVGAGNIHVFELDTNFDGFRSNFATGNTTSTSYVDVPSASVSQTTNTNKLLINATFPLNNGTSQYSLQLLLNGSPIASSPITDVSGVKNGMVSVNWLVENVPKQANLIKLQIKRVSGSDTLTWGAGNFTVIEQSGSLVQDGGGVGGFQTTSATYVDIDGSGISISPLETRVFEKTDSTASTNVTSTSFVDIASHTATTNGGKVLVLISFEHNKGTYNNSSFFRARVDGVTIDNEFEILSSVDQPRSRATTFAVLTSALSAASHTFVFQSRVAAGTLVIRDPVIQVIEIPTLDDSGSLASGKASATSHTLTTSYSDIPNSTITFTTGARRVLLMATIQHQAGASLIDEFTFSVDGTDLDTTAVIKDSEPNHTLFSISFITDELSAASHTFKLRGKSSFGAPFDQAHCIAIELPKIVIGTTVGYARNSSYTNQSVTAGISGDRVSVTGTSVSLTSAYTTKFLYLSQFVSNNASNSGNLDIYVKKNGADYKEFRQAIYGGAYSATPVALGVTVGLLIDITPGTHTFEIEIKKNGATTLFVNPAIASLIELPSQNPQLYGGNSTVTTVPTTQNKALVLYSAPVKNLNSNFALQLALNGSAISSSEITEITGNNEGIVSVGAIVDSLVDGDNIFKAQVKRTSGADPIQISSGQFTVIELPDEQYTGPGVTDLGDTVRVAQSADGFLVGPGERNRASAFQVKSNTGTSGQMRGAMPFPSMTTAERTAMTTEFALGSGDNVWIFNTTTSKLNFWNGAAWEVVTSA